MTATSTPLVPLSIDGFEPDATDRWVIHSALLAQVDDMHAGGVYSWEQEHIEAAEEIVSGLTGCTRGDSPDNYGKSISSKVVVLSLLVVLFDLDHPDLTEEEWAEAERIIELRTEEFGR